jgi:hypothetical protein
VWKTIIADFKAASPGFVTVLGSIGAGTAVSEYDGLGVDGFYFVGVEVEAGYTGTSVRALGSPLFDASAVDAATIYVTLASSDLGIWNPFSWYPYVSPSKWAAIVTEATDTSAIATLVDRGYGYVYLTSETGFETASSLTASVTAALEGTRRLQQSRRLQASEPQWGCDDTLFECKPICVKQMGAVSTKVADTLCAAAPMDQCSCKCLHAAQWVCEGDEVVCKARHGAEELATVGDKVCETRGAPKPTSAEMVRVASECEPVTQMRGSAPADVCLVQWATTEAPPTTAATEAPTTAAPVETQAPADETDSATQAPADETDSSTQAPADDTEETTQTTAAPATTEAPAATAKPIVIAQESLAAVMAFAALALHA